MFSKRFVVALAALAAILGGCDLGVRTEASKGVAAFLDAVHTGDRAAFEAALDRPALRADLRRQIVETAKAQGLDVGGPSEFALDRRVNPQAFKLVEARTGQVLPVAPTAAEVALLMKVIDRDHVCVRDLRRDRCLLTFAKEKDVWRLVAMQATDLKIEVGAAAAKP